MSRPYKFSIIVVFHSGKHYLKLCLDSLINTLTDKDEIIVVVNNTNKDEHDVDFYADRIKYLHYYDNLGHAKAANIGVEEATSEYVVISDHDLIYLPNWIEALWTFYCSDKTLKAVCCKVLDAYSNLVQLYVVASGKFNFSHPYRGMPSDHLLVSKNRYAQMVCTGGFLIKKSDFCSLNGFNVEFGTLYTDLDICLRIKQQGYKVGVAANAMVYHFGTGASKKNKSYKKEFLRMDIRGVLMKNNASAIENDLTSYYRESYSYFCQKYNYPATYFFCNCMSVVDYKWYEELMISLGLKSLGSVYYFQEERDALHINLFNMLGYNIMALGSPVAYFVDSFSSITKNAYWWQERKKKTDIVIDRHANIIAVSEII